MAQDYDYGNKNGPHAWSKICPASCGDHQSPINIVYSKCKVDTSLPPLEIDIPEDLSYTLIRKAHNFQVSIGGTATLKGGPLSSTYKLAQFHFHWDESNHSGSEHLLDGGGFPCELHLVFVNDKYGNLESALSHSDGLAVVGVLLHLSNNDLVGMNQLSTCLQMSTPKCESSLQNGIDLKSLLPGNLKNYFTYPGSLTTPPCSECVTWLVLATAIPISEANLKVMRATHADCEACHTCCNVRPVCPLGDRLLRASFKIK